MLGLLLFLGLFDNAVMKRYSTKYDSNGKIMAKESEITDILMAMEYIIEWESG